MEDIARTLSVMKTPMTFIHSITLREKKREGDGEGGKGQEKMDVEAASFYLPDLLRPDLVLCTPRWQRTGSRPILVWSGEAPGLLCLSPCVCAKRDGGGGRAPVDLSPCTSLPLQHSIVQPPNTRRTHAVSVPPTSCPHCPLPLGLPVHTPPVGIRVQRESLKWCLLDGVVS